MICKRCGKPVADSEDETQLKIADGILNDKRREEIYMAFREEFCTCESRIGSVCTSRPQPPNLDVIERRARHGRSTH